MLPAEDEESTALAPVATANSRNDGHRTTLISNQFMGIVSDHSAGLGHCLKMANQYRAEGLVQAEESVRTLATTLFIQATRTIKK